MMRALVVFLLIGLAAAGTDKAPVETTTEPVEKEAGFIGTICNMDKGVLAEAEVELRIKKITGPAGSSVFLGKAIKIADMEDVGKFLNLQKWNIVVPGMVASAVAPSPSLTESLKEVPDWLTKAQVEVRLKKVKCKYDAGVAEMELKKIVEVQDAVKYVPGLGSVIEGLNAIKGDPAKMFVNLLSAGGAVSANGGVSWLDGVTLDLRLNNIPFPIPYVGLKMRKEKLKPSEIFTADAWKRLGFQTITGPLPTLTGATEVTPVVTAVGAAATAVGAVVPDAVTSAVTAVGDAAGAVVGPLMNKMNSWLPQFNMEIRLKKIKGPYKTEMEVRYLIRADQLMTEGFGFNWVALGLQ